MKKPFNGFATIYALTDEDGNVFYVGCTTGSAEKRKQAHINEARMNDTWTNQYKNEKIRSLNYRVFVKVLETVKVKGKTLTQARMKGEVKERLWIKAFARMGHTLCNKTHGTAKFTKGVREKLMNAA